MADGLGSPRTRRTGRRPVRIPCTPPAAPTGARRSDRARLPPRPTARGASDGPGPLVPGSGRPGRLRRVGVGGPGGSAPGSGRLGRSCRVSPDGTGVLVAGCRRCPGRSCRGRPDGLRVLVPVAGCAGGGVLCGLACSCRHASGRPCTWCCPDGPAPPVRPPGVPVAGRAAQAVVRSALWRALGGLVGCAVPPVTRAYLVSAPGVPIGRAAQPMGPGPPRTGPPTPRRAVNRRDPPPYHRRQ